MADKKISALTGATTPLDGTEVLPIVQSGATVKVANNDLRPKQIQSNATSGVLQVAGPASAATRVMTTPDANFTVARTDAAQSLTGDQTLATGNIIQGTAAKGINFTANTPAAGMTSQLLNWYEEGTWTPVLNRSSTAPSVTYTTQTGTYTRKGREVTLKGNLVWTANSGGTGYFTITGQPFVASATGLNSGVVGLLDGFTYAVGATQIAVAIVSGGNFISFYTFGSAVGGSIVSTVASAGEVDICITYFV